MRYLKRISIGIGILVLVSLGAFVVAYNLLNKPSELSEPNLYTYYQQQDTRPVGEVGIYISQMILPETYDETLYRNVFLKPLKIIPWPIRDILKIDWGTPLYDENRYFELEEFNPTRLIDHRGRDSDLDGIPYIDKYISGEIEFVPGENYTPGYFLYADLPANMPTAEAELLLKARVHYYGVGAGLVDGRVPEEESIKKLVSRTMEKVQAQHGSIKWRWVNAEDYGAAREAMYELLDAGVDTIVFAPPRPIYSHYEEFTGSARQSLNYIRDWESERGNGKEIHFIIAPQLADFDILRKAYMDLLRSQLASITKESSIRVIPSFHGMPWSMVENEAWLELSREYLDKFVQDTQKILSEEYGFKKSDVVLAQDYFTEMTDKYPSTNEMIMKSIEERYDYVINIPVEFITENTDTLFAHAIVNFQGIDEFDVYEPLDYANWDEPFIRKFTQDETVIIYNSVPVGPYQAPLVEAHFRSISSILNQKTP